MLKGVCAQLVAEDELDVCAGLMQLPQQSMHGGAIRVLRWAPDAGGVCAQLVAEDGLGVSAHGQEHLGWSTQAPDAGGVCAQLVAEDGLGVGPRHGVQGVEDHLEVAALQEGAQQLEVEDALQHGQVVLHRVDHLHLQHGQPWASQRCGPRGQNGVLPRDASIDNGLVLTCPVARTGW